MLESACATLAAVTARAIYMRMRLSTRLVDLADFVYMLLLARRYPKAVDQARKSIVFQTRRADTLHFFSCAIIRCFGRNRGAGPAFAMTRVTTITIGVPAVLRDYCDGAKEIPLPASSVRAALEELERRHPSLYRSICDETGTVRRHINLFVNTSHIRDREGLDTALAQGDVVTILPAVSGG